MSKLAIAIDLQALEELMKEFIEERKLAHDSDTWRDMYLSELLIWAQKRQQLTLATTTNEGDQRHGKARLNQESGNT